MVAQLSANMFAGSLPTGPAPTEAELRAQYDAAKAASAKRRAEGFLGQVVLPGEGDFESFRALQLTPYGGLGVSTGPIDTGLGASVGRILTDINMTPEERARGIGLNLGGYYMAPGKPSPRVGPPPPPLYDTPGSASGIEIKGDPNFIADQDITHTFGKDDFYAFKSTLRDPGDMGRYIAPGEEMSYEDFVKFGRPANLAAATSAGYGSIAGGGLVPGSGAGPLGYLGGAVGGILPNVVDAELEGTAEAGGILGGTAEAGGGLLPNSGVSGNLKDATGMPDTRGPNVPGNRPPNPNNSLIDPGFSPDLMGAGRRPVELNPNFRPGYRGEPGASDGMNPVDIYARPQPGMFPQPVETNPIAGISDQPGAGEMPTKPVSASTGPPVGIPEPDLTQRPMPFSGLASLTKLPMFQEFATKLESEHPEASQLFSQMFMGSSQRPMPYQNPFMGMGMGSFYPMMGGMGMGMGGYNPMMGMGGGFNPMMGGMGMGGYSPFMGMNPMMGMGGGFNPMMGMSGGGLGSFYPQPSTYGPPQSMPSMGGYPTPPQSSPFGGAMRGYYA